MTWIFFLIENNDAWENFMFWYSPYRSPIIIAKTKTNKIMCHKLRIKWKILFSSKLISKELIFGYFCFIRYIRDIRKKTTFCREQKVKLSDSITDSILINWGFEIRKTNWTSYTFGLYWLTLCSFQIVILFFLGVS